MRVSVKVSSECGNLYCEVLIDLEKKKNEDWVDGEGGEPLSPIRYGVDALLSL